MQAIGLPNKGNESNSNGPNEIKWTSRIEWENGIEWESGTP